MIPGKTLSASLSAQPLYVEDVFSTYLYTGNSSTQTITNDIDLAGEGGLVWIKSRSSGATYYDHVFCDTVRGNTKYLASSGVLATSGEQVGFGSPYDIASFNNNGFTLGQDTTFYKNTGTSTTYASWTFRKAEKFFDVVTYTGNGGTSRAINHNLGSTPGCIIVKRTDSTGDWYVYHRGLATSGPEGWFVLLNSTAARAGAPSVWDLPPTSTTFTVQAPSSNINGATYVAYLFAHDAGGFGDSGSDNVITCGSYAGTGSTGLNVNLGYEPQWLMIKSATTTGNWWMLDNMRGFVAPPGSSSYLVANSTAAELAASLDVNVTNTGFQINTVGSSINNSGQTYIYIAIRRGPMKTPEAGAEVYNAIVRTGTGTAASITGAGFPPDLMISHSTNVSSNNVAANDKLRGAPQLLSTNTTNAEATLSGTLLSFDQDGFSVGTTASGPFNVSGQTNVGWMFRRAPGFFDVVCWSGDGTYNRPMPHNLGVVPELIIFKARTYDYAVNWVVWQTSLGGTLPAAGNYLALNTNAAVSTNSQPQDALPTATQLTLRPSGSANASNFTYVAYLFATLAGVSKVGSYTGTGTTQQINCGFTGGARFVLIKRTDSTGDWYVWDTARGIVSGNDPYLLLNSTAAEVTSTDYIDTYSQGFEISSTAPAEINANGGTYIYLAIA